MKSHKMGLKAWLGSKSPEFARIILVGVSVECPLGDCTEGCPLAEVRTKPLEVRKEMINSMSEEDIRQLYATHYGCLKNRDSEE